MRFPFGSDWTPQCLFRDDDDDDDDDDVIRKIQKGRIGEASNPGPLCMKKSIIVQQVNVTQMDKNGHHVVSNDGDATGICEHKLTKNKLEIGKRSSKANRRRLCAGRRIIPRKPRRQARRYAQVIK